MHLLPTCGNGRGSRASGCARAGLLGVAAAVSVAGLQGVRPADAGTAQVLVSSSSSRSSAAPLAGRTVSGRIAVFVPAATGMRSVSFSLDGRSPHVEFAAPFDFAGTAADGSAVPFDTGSLGAGTHTVRATVTSSSGASSVSSSFNVAAPAGRTSTSTSTSTSISTPALASLLSATSPFLNPIPAAPLLDPSSAAIIASLKSGAHIADAYEYSVPTYEATSTDPSYSVTDVTYAGSWGANPLARYNPIRIPSSAAPAVGDDAWMAVVDRSRHIVVTMWRARKSGSTWRCDWAGVYPLPGVGNDSDALSGFGTGSGMDVLAGLITPEDIRAGVINHALVFSTDMGHPSAFRWPATKTDAGQWPNSFPAKLPEGSRVQLDPSVDVDRIPGITPVERMIAHALQRYGAYNGDHGGARMAFGFQGQDLTDPARKPPLKPGNGTRPGGVYYNAGISWDYQDLTHIPWTRLRVLRSWNGR